MDDFADIALAARIERLGVASQRALVGAYRERFPEFGAQALDVAGGVAAFVEPGSPVNGAVGLGLSGEVDADDLAEVERFLRGRGERPLIAIAPCVDPSLTALLERGGWAPSALEDVLVREIDAAETFAPPPAGVDITFARTAAERELWAILVANGFSAPEDPSAADVRLGHAAVAAPDNCFLIACVDGRPAGTGELHLEDGIGWLSADTTLPQFRRRGVHGALQRARLALARDAGCELALTEAMPGSASERNMQRLGFRVAYTRVELLAPEQPGKRTAS